MMQRGRMTEKKKVLANVNRVEQEEHAAGLQGLRAASEAHARPMERAERARRATVDVESALLELNPQAAGGMSWKDVNNTLQKLAIDMKLLAGALKVPN